MPWGNQEESVLEKFLREIEGSQKMTVYCAFCPKWKASGTAEETRKAQDEHMQERHPDKARKKKLPGKRRSRWSEAMSVERQEEIEAERTKRMLIHGLTGEGEDAEST